MSPSLQSVIGLPDRGAGGQNYDSAPGLGGGLRPRSSAADLSRGCGKSATLSRNSSATSDSGLTRDGLCARTYARTNGLPTGSSHDQRDRMPGTCRRMSADGRSRAHIPGSIHSDRHGANVGAIGARGGTERANSHPQTSAPAVAARDRPVRRKITRPRAPSAASRACCRGRRRHISSTECT
jgi:hypothetical protein